METFAFLYVLFLLFIQVSGLHNLELGDGKQFSRYFLHLRLSLFVWFFVFFFTPRLCVAVFARRVLAFMAKMFARVWSTVWQSPCISL